MLRHVSTAQDMQLWGNGEAQQNPAEAGLQLEGAPFAPARRFCGDQQVGAEVHLLSQDAKSYSERL